MVPFQLPLLLICNCITVLCSQLGLNAIWLSLNFQNNQSPDCNETTTIDPLLPVREWPEEQLATSVSDEANFSVVDLTKVLEDSKKNGPSWKSRFNEISLEDREQNEESTYKPVLSEKNFGNIKETQTYLNISQEASSREKESTEKKNFSRKETSFDRKKRIKPISRSSGFIDLNTAKMISGADGSSKAAAKVDGIIHILRDLETAEAAANSEGVESGEIELEAQKSDIELIEDDNDIENLNEAEDKDGSDDDSWYNKVKKLPSYKKGDASWIKHMAKTPWKERPNDEQFEPRFPIYDPSYPRWEAGNSKRPGQTNVFAYIPSPNGLFIDDDRFKSKKLKKLSGPGDVEENSNKMSSGELQRYIEEIKVGDLTQLHGTNLHIAQPSHYRLVDLGRRFHVQYLDKDGDEKYFRNAENNVIIPERAPPELVLAVAKQSALLEAAKPVDPNEYIEKQKALRSGNYWNSYWKEDIADPLSALRSSQPERMESLRVKLSPGSPIYEYVSKLNKLYPKLLYVVNKKG